jgi:hypothetical protein
MNTLLADAVVIGGGGSGLVHGLFMILIIGICVGIIWWVGKWVITKLGGAPIAFTVWNGLFILVGTIIIINFLLSLIGRGFIQY